jgi:hypothetical protein
MPRPQLKSLRRPFYMRRFGNEIHAGHCIGLGDSNYLALNSRIPSAVDALLGLSRLKGDSTSCSEQSLASVRLDTPCYGETLQRPNKVKRCNGWARHAGALLSRAGAKMRVGRPSSYKPEYAKMAFHLRKLGATDADLADAFEVSVVTIDNWKLRYPEFLGSLKARSKPRIA